ncbi:TadC Flp pilus assembly protein TadC [Candidatus Nanopelagicaceae bacterium]
MRIEYSIPLMLAILAFAIADEDDYLIGNVAKRSYRLPGKESVQNRLNKLGRNQEQDYENFRIAQLSYSTAALFLLTIAYFLSIFGFATFLLLIAVSIASIFVLTDRALSQKCSKKRADVEDEFPAVVEMLTLAVGAGESPATALKRIATRAKGYLAEEFQGLVRDIEKGQPFTNALDGMSHRVQSESLRRFVDSLIISISRGTPLVETLSHSAQEARNKERVLLMSAAGKSEISMMIPVVFLILPISILFALFPSLTNLNLFSN